MNLKRHLPYGLLIISYLLCCGARAQRAATQPGWIYIKMEANSTLESQTNQLTLHQLREVKSYRPLKKSSSVLRTASSSAIDGLYKVQVTEGTDILKLCDSLEHYGNVRYAEPIYQEQLLYIPNDPAVSDGLQPYLDLINAFAAWDITRGDSTMIIGISDTGVNYQHPDLENKMYVNESDPPNGIDDDNNGYIDDYTGYDFADQDTSALPGSDDHGTRVAGIAGAEADNGYGMTGIGINTRIAALKVFNSLLGGSSNAYESIIYAAENGYDVINLSWGSENSYSQAAQDIIDYAVEEMGMVVVAAAGNTPQDLDFYPASYDNVLSVASTELNDTKASFSTFSYQVDLTAPGRSIYATSGDNGFTPSDGTSFSSPIVAATAALVKTQFPTLNARQIIERIRVTTDDISSLNTNYADKIGFGRLNMERALAAGSDTLKSIRLEDYSVNTATGSRLFYGDSIALTVTLKNYLAASSPQVSVSSPSPYLEYSSEPTQLQTIETLGAATTVLKARIAHNTPENTTIPIKISFEDGHYADYEYIEVQTEPDRYDLDNEVLTFTTSGNGNLAYASDGFINGLGLTYNDNNILNRMSFFVSMDTNQVADNFYLDLTSSLRHEDFATIEMVKPRAHEAIDMYSASTFSDDSASIPAGLAISQRTLLDNSSSYLIQEYYVGNASTEDYDNLSIGLFADWDLHDASTNKSYYNDSLKAMIALDADSTTFVGIRSYYDTLPVHQALDLQNLNGNAADITGEWTDSLIFALAQKTLYDTAGWSGGNDISSFLADDSLQLTSGGATKVAYILAFAPTLPALALALDSGEAAYEGYLETPLLLEEFISCQGASLAIAPQSGDQFNFYTDPFGENLLTSNDTLWTGSIDQDTSFYARNTDSLAIGDIYRLDVSLVSKVADFVMSADTLFLDEHTNSVSFQDRSFLPTDWLWDFGNQQQATLQNPTVGYSTPGVYTIMLTVNNELGCHSSTSQNLLVAQRPELPIINDIQICPGHTALVQATNTDSLAFYLAESDVSPFFEGSNLTLDNMSGDTTFYVSNTSGTFESLKIPVRIEVILHPVTYSMTANLSSPSTSAMLINTSVNAASTEWTIDGQIVSTNDSLILEVTKDTYSLQIKSTSTFGCESTWQENIQLEPSPAPVLAEQVYCHGEDAIVSPTNGDYFAFYADEGLNNLLLKGSELVFDSLISDQNIYITGIDHILPSAPLEVVLSPQQPHADIVSSPDTLFLDERFTATFTISNSSLLDLDWFLNETYYDNAEEIIVFFEEEGSYQISLQVTDTSGCIGRDTLDYQVLSEREVITLGNTPSLLTLFPNPLTTGQVLRIRNLEKQGMLRVIDLSGKEIFSQPIKPNQSVDLSTLGSGTYTLQIVSETARWTELLIIR